MHKSIAGIFLSALFIFLFNHKSEAQVLTPQWVNNYSSLGEQNVMLGYQVDSAGYSYSFFYVEDSAMFSTITGHYLIKYSPTGQQLWLLNIPGQGYSQGKLCLSGNKNLYTCITYWNGNGVDFLLSRIDTAGNILWQDSIGSPQNSEGGEINSMTVNDSENIFIAGTNQNQDKAVLVKCDSSGIIKWLNFYSMFSGPYDRGNAITVDKHGNVYAAIDSMDSTFFYNTVLVKYSPSGQMIWQKRIVDTLEGVPLFVKASSDTEIYIVGNVVNPGGGWSDYQTLKFDSSGNIIWSKIFDAENYYNLTFNTVDTPQDMLITHNGNIVITGDCVDSGMPWWVNIMYDSHGNLKWVGRDFQTSMAAYGRSIAEDPSGNLVFAGDVYDSTYGSPIGLSKYDTLGNRTWTTEYSYQLYDNGYYKSTVGVDYTGNIFCSSGNLLYYSINSVTTLKYDYFAGINTLSETDEQFFIYPNPANDIISFKTKNFVEEIIFTNQLGREVRRQKINGETKIEISVVGLADGMYFYQVVEKDNVKLSGKFIVQH